MSFFNPLDPFYKTPFGAASTGEPVRFRLRFPQHFSVLRAALLLERDGRTERFPMTLCGREDGFDTFRLSLPLQDPGICYYSFEGTNCYGQAVPVKQGARFQGEVDDSLPPYQLTVYAKEYRTPDFLKGGVMYQIFPDRFYRSGRPKQDVPADRVLRDDWGGMPVWQPDAQGKIRNNDYFCGDLAGIEGKLPYLQELGVTCLYLNPIFEAHSNHRYNTASYERVDPLLGTNEEFEHLAAQAKKHGISILLDGVFSHTGDDSVYFNKQGRYGEHTGACRDWNSPYRSWYQFEQYPDRYKCWWGIDTLPELHEDNPEYQSYITGPQGIARQWLQRGAAGFRLDVADELPDSFLYALHDSVKSAFPDALILGEVWEDASTKVSYGARRPYLLGRQLDSVMNYPFKNAVLDYLTGGSPLQLEQTLLTILQNYPKPTVDVLMNFLSTHDVERAITRLAGDDLFYAPREQQAGHDLSPEQYARGKRLLKLAYGLLFFLPGVPCIYYGDEIGMQGYRDPFNRGCFTWDRQDTELLSFIKTLSRIRHQTPCLKTGNFHTVSVADGCFAFERRDGESALLVLCNPTGHRMGLPLGETFDGGEVLMGSAGDGFLWVEPGDLGLVRAGNKKED